MQTILWNTELITLIGMACVIAIALGYLAAFITNQRRLAALQKQLHDNAIITSRLEQQLIAAHTSQSRIEQHLQQSLQQLQAERTTLNQLQQQLAEEGKKAKMFETAGLQAKEYITDLKGQLQQQHIKLSELQAEHLQLTKQHTELDTSLQQREKHFEQQLAQLAENKQILSKEFENLANKIFEEKGKTFTDTSQHSIDVMLKPFREQIDAFQKRVNEVHDSATRGNANLNAEIKKVLDIGVSMSTEANNLTSALKGDSQQRGAWGEAQLQRTLEMSGLVQDAHFSAQTAFKDSDGKNKQTDFLIKLPDNKHIIIDSKVSLVAYDRAVAAETNDAYLLAMAEHNKAVRRHIDDLASKDYTNLIGMHSPSFVLMFMPIEPAYIEALKHNKDLFEYGYKQNIVLVSHTTLIPILRTVSNLWMIERSNTEAREISERAAEVYNQVCLVAERLQKLGVTLNTVSNHYNSTVTALAGQQGLYGKVDRFSQLSAKVSKTLPALETSHRDFESERLSMMIEPIPEPTAESIAEPIAELAEPSSTESS
ncbi:DNA recombination protein RmuC [Rheinheimera salexigens]|uniref:Recombinase RmuC n=1 Tax=Rheinheimera salexigens TaxID=1628148 RepID=A0A1E7Q3C8_9GAMM|nr:DNA recombination protein RmuC [Rheinheimera salexigens]OEY68657.1 recombinase RmuC [Rheinheimera salexigens]